MKVKFLIIILGMIVSVSCYSQNIVSALKEFYKNADMNCYIDMAQKRMMKEYDLLCQWDSLYKLISPPDIDLHRGNTVPILNVQFVDTENYSYSDNIYDYITIDSVWMFSFICINKWEINAFVNTATPYRTYYFDDNKESAKFLRKINKNQPDLLLYCAILQGGFGNKADDGYMYIKDDKIYKFMTNSGKSYELNEYFRNYLRIEDIRRYLNFSYIPLVYQKDKSERRTGNAPKKEKMICSDPFTGSIEIGPAAFGSSSELKATIVHEFGHSVKDRILDANGNFVGWQYPQGSFVSTNSTLVTDGPIGYANEIFNAGKLHINPQYLKPALAFDILTVLIFKNMAIQIKPVECGQPGVFPPSQACENDCAADFFLCAAVDNFLRSRCEFSAQQIIFSAQPF